MHSVDQPDQLDLTWAEVDNISNSDCENDCDSDSVCDSDSDSDSDSWSLPPRGGAIWWIFNAQC